MTGRETHGGTLTLQCANDAEYPSPRDEAKVSLSNQLGVQHFPAPPQERAVFRVKAPFLLTRMRDWRGLGRKQTWLWSRRGREWVIDQELYLGRTQAQKPLVHESPLIATDSRTTTFTPLRKRVVDGAYTKSRRVA